MGPNTIGPLVSPPLGFFGAFGGKPRQSPHTRFLLPTAQLTLGLFLEMEAAGPWTLVMVEVLPPAVTRFLSLIVMEPLLPLGPKLGPF